MRTQILLLLILSSALVGSKQTILVQAQEDDNYCLGQCEGRKMEYRYNPISASWKAHFAMAFQMDCELASITSPDEQQAALEAMEPYMGYPYHIVSNTSYSFEASFVYLGARTVESDPDTGRYIFEWMDGSGEFEVERNVNTLEPYTNFLFGDPNGNGESSVEDETYLAMSLNENDSVGVPRGMWIDFGLRNSPALYKCCAPPPKTTCVGSKKEYHINPIPATWEEHAIMAREMSCELASVTNPEEQGQVEALVESLDTMATNDSGLANLGGSFLYMGARRILSKLPNRYIFEWTDGSGRVEYGRTTSYNNFAEPATTSTVDPNPPSGRNLYLALSLTNDPTPPVESTDEETQRGPALYQCCHEHGGSRCQR